MLKKQKQLSKIRSKITKLNQNSFVVKGISLTIVIAFLVFIRQLSQFKYAFLLIAGLMLLCILDTHYLQTERRYKKMYELTEDKEEDMIDFDMKITDMQKNKHNSFFVCLFSKSIILFYLPLILILLIIAIIV